MESIPVASHTIEDQIVVMTPKHTIDNSNVGEFLRAIDLAYSLGSQFVILDMHDLEFLSSAGVGAIFSFVEKFRKRKGDIVFCNLTDAIAYVLSELDVADYLTVKKTKEDALALCRSRRDSDEALSG
jgi:anti-anti-sigma factor